MTATAAPPRPAAGPRRWTVEEYHRLGDLGFFEGQRVELIEGEVVVMSPMNSPHVTAVLKTQRALMALFEPTDTVRTQMPLRFPRSEPEPDLAVVQGPPDADRATPADILLVVEISDTTLRRDLGVKADLYARHGVGDYWVLDLNARQLVIHREPDAGRYRRVRRRRAGAIAPLARPGAAVAVAGLLP